MVKRRPSEYHRKIPILGDTDVLIRDQLAGGPVLGQDLDDRKNLTEIVYNRAETNVGKKKPSRGRRPLRVFISRPINSAWGNQPPHGRKPSRTAAGKLDTPTYGRNCLESHVRILGVSRNIKSPQACAKSLICDIRNA